MNKEGAKGVALRKMQEAAWRANKGRPRSQETREKIRAARIEKRRKGGATFSPYFENTPLFVNENHWSVFISNGKVKKAHARLVYEKYTGPIPRGYVVHHIDGDGFNDALDNLIALPRKEHYFLHLYWEIVNHWEGKEIDGKTILQKYREWRKP
jgi:HNH endonuclease